MTEYIESFIGQHSKFIREILIDFNFENNRQYNIIFLHKDVKCIAHVKLGNRPFNNIEIIFSLSDNDPLIVTPIIDEFFRRITNNDIHTRKLTKTYSCPIIRNTFNTTTNIIYSGNSNIYVQFSIEETKIDTDQENNGVLHSFEYNSM